MKKVLRWKFLRTGLKSNSGDHTWEIGKWYEHEGELSICNSGFHCSKEIGQAFSYVGGEYLAQVEVRGKCDEQSDKEAWTEMRVVKVWEWTKKDSVEIAIFTALQVIEIFEKQYPNDDRPRKAIEAAKAWLENPTDAAADAAAYAADAASASSNAAAYVAAADAAYAASASSNAAAFVAAAAAADAARTAAADAHAAADAAYATMQKKIYARFNEQLKKLKKYDNKA